MKWMKRIAIGVIFLTVLAFIFRGKITQTMIAFIMAPQSGFENFSPPPTPDYSLDANWAALPSTVDGADLTPKETPQVRTTDVAVFFIHPTTYLSKDAWNAPLNDPESKQLIDDLVMTGQASTFAGCCDVFAPRYRQATLYSFWDTKGDGIKARNFAFTDIERAFDEFLSRIGTRDFIIAGHSQGAEHTVSLLKKRISGTPLKARMAAAYPVGIGINTKDFAAAAPDIPVCNTPAQTGCYVSWNTLGAKAKAWPGLEGSTCVNPLSWKADREPVGANKHTGAIAVSTEEQRFETGVSDAQCTDDRLLVGKFHSDMYDDLPLNMGKDNYHVLDYSLFYASIRQNAITRATAFEAR